MRNVRRLAWAFGAVLVLVFMFAPAYAYRHGGQTLTTPVTNVFTGNVTSAQAIASDGGRSSMHIYNSSSTATCFLSHGSFGDATMNGAGSIPLGPLANWITDNTADTDSINIICNAAGVPITILTWD